MYKSSLYPISIRGINNISALLAQSVQGLTYGLDNPGFESWRVKLFFCSTSGPDSYLEFYPRCKTAEVAKLISQFYLAPRLRMELNLYCPHTVRLDGVNGGNLFLLKQ